MCRELFHSQSMFAPKKRRSSPIVVNDGCATPSLRGGKVETEKHGSLVGLRRREGASDMQLYVGRQNLDYLPIQKIWDRCYTTWLKKRRSGTWAPKPAILWWRRTHKAEERSEVLVCHRRTDVQVQFRQNEDSGICDEQAGEDSLDAIEECSLPTRPFGGTALHPSVQVTYPRHLLAGDTLARIAGFY